MELNSSQRAAVEHDGGHLLVLAGAGTGKTRVIVERAVHLLRLGFDPARILLLTFTRRASREMKARMKSSSGPVSDSVPAGTFHHFCLARMRSMPGAFGVENWTVIDRDDQLQIMRMVRAAYRKKGERFPKAGELIQVHSYARNTNITPDQYIERFSPFDEEVIERVLACMKDYTTRKKAGNYLDFDDILHIFALKLHTERNVRERLRKQYDHVLVDEMQDTNPLQMLILEGLRDPAKLFCVGDDAQSIYAFRGADFRNIHNFTAMIPGAEVLKLERNYRSRQEILDLANWLLSESGLEYGRILESTRGNGPKPVIIDFDSDLEEAGWIVSDIIERKDAGSKWSDHMVIARTGYSARATEAAMIEKKVPYRYIGGTQLFHAAHVKDVLCMIRCVASLVDEIAWMRYLTLWPGIGEKTGTDLTAAIARNAGGSASSVIEILIGHPKVPTSLVEGLQALSENWGSPQTAMGAACEALQDLLSIRYPRWEMRKRDLDLLVRLSARHRTVEAFLETYALDPMTASMIARLEEDDCVTLITAHSAKGTEARVCYLLKAEPGQYPHQRSLGDEDSEEEERRVLYVAMTRSMDELILTRSLRRVRSRWSWGLHDGPQAYGTSDYFLANVPLELLETGLEGNASPEDEPAVIVPWRRE